MGPKCFVCQTMPRAVATQTFGPRVGTTLDYTVHNKTQGPSDCFYRITANKIWRTLCLIQRDRNLSAYSSSLWKVLHDLGGGGWFDVDISWTVQVFGWIGDFWQHFPHTQDSHRYLCNCQMHLKKKKWFRRAQPPPSCIIDVIDHSGSQMCLLSRNITYLALLCPFQQLRVLFSSAASELQILWGKSFQKSLAISTFPLISRTKRSNDVPAAVVGRTICCWLCFLPGFHPKEKSS